MRTTKQDNKDDGAAHIPTATMLEAIRWRHRLNTEEDLETLWFEFEAWLEQSPQHQAAYHRAEKAHCERELFQEALKERRVTEEALVAELSPRPPLLPQVLWVSAPIVLILSVAVVITYRDEMPWVPYSTAAGEGRTVILEDGSLVQLDTASAIRARQSWRHRNVVLDHGQALFAPLHQWWRVFDVTVNQHVVRATGTRFVVDKKNDQESDALVEEGQVKVLSTERSRSTEPVREVRAGQMVRIGPGAPEVQTVSADELARRLAWIEGMLDFDETLEQAVEEFNRYNHRVFVIDDPALRTLPVAGRFDAHQPDLFAQHLKTTHQIEHTSVGGAPGSEAGEIHLKSGAITPQGAPPVKTTIPKEAK